MAHLDFVKVEGFDWDEGDLTKNWEKHKVASQEAEDIFRSADLKIIKDESHSQHEERFLIYGQTGNSRLLTLTITFRNNRIRIISARDMSKKERKAYEKKA